MTTTAQIATKAFAILVAAGLLILGISLSASAEPYCVCRPNAPCNCPR
jgi:hypothetical protein